MLNEIAFASNIAETKWRNQSGCQAFERWHFDALSDDGREALIIKFYDNFALSPRYFKRERNANGAEGAEKKFPAVSFSYSVDGKTMIRAINEFDAGSLSVSDNAQTVTVGNSSFRLDAAEYGTGFFLEIDLLTARKRKIKAELEWLSIESDLFAGDAADHKTCWNVAVPRSDVSGRITLFGRTGKTRRLVHFRGTGYHDHLRCGSSIREDIGSRFWGRAHFTDATAVFHYHEIDKLSGCAKLFLIRDGVMKECEISALENSFERNRYGLLLPNHVSLLSNDNISLLVTPQRIIKTGFFESTIVSEMTLTLEDGEPRKTIGITELITPMRMKSALLRGIADMRIGKNGKGPLF